MSSRTTTLCIVVLTIVLTTANYYIFIRNIYR